MSESLPTDSIKPDVHQPRTEFNEEVIEGYVRSLETLGQINPIEIDENNVIIRHEQLWRAATKLGLEQILVVRKMGLRQARRFERQLADHDEDISAIDKIWAYATGVVNINADANYTKEDIKEMYKNDYGRLVNLLTWSYKQHEKLGQAELSRRIGVNQKTISNYLSFFKAPKTLATAFLNGNIEIVYLYRISSLQSDSKKEEIAKILVEDIAKPIDQRRFRTERELGTYIQSFNIELEKQATVKAKELKKEIKELSPKNEKEPKPQKPKIEPSKEEVNAKAKEKAKKPPKPKKTDEEIARGTLLKSGGKSGSVSDKVEKAEKLGIDVSKYLERLEEAITKIDDNPKTAWAEGKTLKKELDAAINIAKQTEKQKKQLEAAKEKAIREAKAEADKKIAEEKKRLALEAEIEKRKLDDERRKLTEERKKLEEDKQREIEKEKERLKRDPSFRKSIELDKVEKEKKMKELLKDKDITEEGHRIGRELGEAQLKLEALKKQNNVRTPIIWLRLSIKSIIKRQEKGEIFCPNHPESKLIWDCGDTLEDTLTQINEILGDAK